MRHLLNRRPSPAMVVAIVALVLAATGAAAAKTEHAGSGSAHAASTSCKHRHTQSCEVRALVESYLKAHRKSLRGATGPAGPAGPAGAAGAAGPAGPAGPGRTIRQIVVNGDGTTQYRAAGISVTRAKAGNYMINWSGFPGTAHPYCQGIGRNGTVLGAWTYPNGTGNVTIDFGGTDTVFYCAIIGEST